MNKSIAFLKALPVIFLSAHILFVAHSVFATENSVEDAIQRAEEKAYQQRLEAQNKTKAIDNFYNRGVADYDKQHFLGAIENFEEVLKISPDYEPAKLYLECSILGQKLTGEQEKIDALKLKMADIIAEYDARIKEISGLAFGYLLEQAKLRCQAQDYNGADYYYNLCYKLDPQAKEQISWFVNATYELKDLAASLDECYARIEDLSGSGPGNVNTKR